MWNLVKVGNTIDNGGKIKNYIFNFIEPRFCRLLISIGFSDFKFNFALIF